MINLVTLKETRQHGAVAAQWLLLKESNNYRHLAF